MDDGTTTLSVEGARERDGAALPAGTVNERCEACGYRLVGLPAEGRCPECAADYDQDVVRLRGGGDRADAERAAGHPWAYLWRRAVYLLRAAAMLPTAVREWDRNPMPHVMVGTIFLSIAVEFVMRAVGEGPAPLRVHLRADGAKALHEPRPRGARVASAAFSTALLLTAVVVLIRSPGNGQAVASAVGMLVAIGLTTVLVAVIPAVRRWWWRAVVDDDAADLDVLLWPTVTAHEVREVAPERYRIRLRGRNLAGAKWRIEAIVVASAAQADLVRRFVEARVTTVA